MALLFCDGFDSYGVTNDTLAKYTSNGWSYVSNAGRNGGGCIQATSAVNVSGPTATPSAYSVVSGSVIGFAFWLKCTAAPSGTTQILQSRSTQFGLDILTSGKMQMLGGGSLIGSTSTFSVCDSNWHWIEYREDGGASNNSLWVDNVNVALNVSSAGNSTATGFTFSGYASNTMTLDDLIIFDSNAGGPVTSSMPLNPRVISTIRPSSDNSIQFTPDTGSTNNTQVNEAAADDDTHYVQDNVSGHVDLYGYGALGFTPASITGIQANTRVKNPGSGTINFKTRCSSTGTTSDSSSTVTPSAYATYRQAYNTDPHTSAAWSASGLAAALFGVTVV